jgi:hypothetical protein
MNVLKSNSSTPKVGSTRGNQVRMPNRGEVRPFFGFYGGKWRDAIKHYPSPREKTIVEPFAGSAGYSLRYHERNVILCEIDPVLAAIWAYLIRVRPAEVLSIPDLGHDQTVDDLRVAQEAKWLIGFWLNRGVSTPRKSPSRWMRDGIRPGSFWGARVRQTIAQQVTKIRHWRILNRNYYDAPAIDSATWFIDPPYQCAGRHYRFSSDEIDYKKLGAWCKDRKKQVIVCENDGANWLPFSPLADVKTTRAGRRSKEVIWLREHDCSKLSRKVEKKGART